MPLQAHEGPFVGAVRSEPIYRAMHRRIGKRAGPGFGRPQQAHRILDSRIEMRTGHDGRDNCEDAEQERCGICGVPIGPPMKCAREKRFDQAHRLRDQANIRGKFPFRAPIVKEPERGEMDGRGDRQEIDDPPHPDDVPYLLLLLGPLLCRFDRFCQLGATPENLAIFGYDCIIRW
jgi:hypothetical protein